jgi:hypothetical protein
VSAWWIPWAAAVVVLVWMAVRAVREPFERAQATITAARVDLADEDDPDWDAGIDRLWDALHDHREEDS